MEKVYLCIDLKSFYASVECVERGLNPFTSNLVVADPSRGRGAICLAISPAMKNLGIKNRCRIFEIPDKLSYITAKPRMKLYMKYSADIYGIYLRYIAKEDIYVYSVDECFFDVTSYLKLYNKTPVEIAKMLIDAVYNETGICATSGIGTNLFLAKVALDISAKHSKDNIGMLDIEKFKKTIWHHKPITDIWNVGKGIANRLKKYGIDDLYGVAHIDEKILYKEFGVNAQFLIDHAKGIEPCTIADIHNYIPQSASVSTGQILFEDYSYDDALIVLKEMIEPLVLEIVEKNLVTNSVSLYVGYSKNIIKTTGGTVKLENFTSSLKKITDAFISYYIKTTQKGYPIRKLNIGLNNLIEEEFTAIDLFSDYAAEEKERDRLKVLIDIKEKFGKNAVLKGISLNKKATARVRNKMVGGHNGE
ncbi:MAG: DNA repair protein [Ruminococcaceae bacterium]|nr:DNA repair protein [Oscillospiraceae bacterium]